MATFIAEHDFHISIIDYPPELIGAVCPDSKIAKDLAFGRTKATAFLNNVLGEEEHKQLIQHLKNNRFSLIVESLNKRCVKHMFLVARVLIIESVMDFYLVLFP